MLQKARLDPSPGGSAAAAAAATNRNKANGTAEATRRESLGTGSQHGGADATSGSGQQGKGVAATGGEGGAWSSSMLAGMPNAAHSCARGGQLGENMGGGWAATDPESFLRANLSLKDLVSLAYMFNFSEAGVLGLGERKAVVQVSEVSFFAYLRQVSHP